MRINSALYKYVLPKEEDPLFHKAQFLEKQDLKLMSHECLAQFLCCDPSLTVLIHMIVIFSAPHS